MYFTVIIVLTSVDKAVVHHVQEVQGVAFYCFSLESILHDTGIIHDLLSPIQCISLLFLLMM